MMERHAHGARHRLRALIPALLLALGCAPSTTITPGAPVKSGPAVAHGVGDGRHVALEAVPSAAAAELLPANAHYRAVLDNGELALVIVGSDRRILARLEVANDAPARATVGTRIDYEDIDGDAAQIEAWSFAGSIDGRAAVGQRSARFRVRLEPDGSLAGERWSVAHPGSSGLIELRRARAIAADLSALTIQLAQVGALTDPDRCELSERLALAELALELSVRAWAGDDRARLPASAAFIVPDLACGP